MKSRALSSARPVGDSTRAPSADYKAWVSRLPCCACQPSTLANPWAHLRLVRSSDPHHLFGPEKTFGRRPADRYVIPLCRGPQTENHHERFQRLGRFVAASAVYSGENGERFVEARYALWSFAWYAAFRLREAWADGERREIGL